MNRFADCLKTLGDETRLRLLLILQEADAPLYLAELVDIVRRPQYAVSRAMGALVRAGLVSEQRQGKLRIYTFTSTDSFNSLLLQTIAAIPREEIFDPDDLDRLRWRLELRDHGRCVVTYTDGYTPPEFTGVPTQKPRVLFVCVHNSARSQIAEAYTHRYAGDLFEAESAGLTPERINPHVIAVMAEEGFDLSVKIPRSVHQVYRSGRTFRYVITVCNPVTEAGCPSFPGPVDRLNWPFPDPGTFTGSEEEILTRTRLLRDEIEDTVHDFVTRYRNRNQTEPHREEL